MRRRTAVVLGLLAAAVALGAGFVALHVPWSDSATLAAHVAALHGGGPQHTAQPQAVAAADDGAERRREALDAARRGVADLGRRWDAAARDTTVRLYADIHREIAWPGVLEPETFNYGPHPQQTLTLWRPEQEFSEPSLVLLFLHGDGIDGASQTLPGSDGLMFAHMGRLAATFGGIGVLADYRTDGGSDAGDASDVRRVLEWIRANVSPWGGDPDTVVLVANSQGATRAAEYLFDESTQLDDGTGIAVAFLSSGRFGDLAPHLRDLVDAYDGERVPLALWSAGLDPAEVEIGIADLFAQLCRKYGDCPRLTQLPGYNHLSHILSLGTDDTTVMEALISFYHTVR